LGQGILWCAFINNKTETQKTQTHAYIQERQKFLLVASALRDLVEDSLVRDLAEVSALDLSTETDELLAEVVLRGGVDHLLLKLGGIRAPAKGNEQKIPKA